MTEVENIISEDNIDKVELTIEKYESMIHRKRTEPDAEAVNLEVMAQESEELNYSTINCLISLYNKAIEYYSSNDDSK